MKIQVTREDIDNGDRGSNTYCPVALAIKRHTGRFAYVNTSWVSLGHLAVERIYLPPEVGRFVSLFDGYYLNRLDHQPFEFELDYED